MDVLKHLSSEEISANALDASPGDRLGRLARHVLAQQRCKTFAHLLQSLSLSHYYYCFLKYLFSSWGMWGGGGQLLSSVPGLRGGAPGPLVGPESLGNFTASRPGVGALRSCPVHQGGEESMGGPIWLTSNSIELNAMQSIQVLPLEATGSDEETRRSCMWVNPGRLAKGVGGGTFVQLFYQANADHTAASIIRM